MTRHEEFQRSSVRSKSKRLVQPCYNLKENSCQKKQSSSKDDFTKARRASSSSPSSVNISGLYNKVQNRDDVSSPLYHSPVPPNQDKIYSHLEPNNDCFTNDWDNNVHLNRGFRSYRHRRPKHHVGHHRVPQDRIGLKVYPAEEQEYLSETEYLYQKRYRNDPPYAMPTRKQKYLAQNTTKHNKTTLAVHPPVYVHQSFRTRPSQLLNSNHLATQRFSYLLASRTQSPDDESYIDVHGAVDGCGGHCIAFQNFLYYFLQVTFVIIILTGIALFIAGAMIRERSNDLFVLVYIGGLITTVSMALLIMQYYFRRNVKQRKKKLRLALTSSMPMNDMSSPQRNDSGIISSYIDNSPNRVVKPKKNIISTSQHLELNRNSGLLFDQKSRYSSPTQSLPDQDGVPWWRREPYIYS